MRPPQAAFFLTQCQEVTVRAKSGRAQGPLPSNLWSRPLHLGVFSLNLGGALETQSVSVGVGPSPFFFLGLGGSIIPRPSCETLRRLFPHAFTFLSFFFRLLPPPPRDPCPRTISRHSLKECSLSTTRVLGETGMGDLQNPQQIRQP